MVDPILKQPNFIERINRKLMVCEVLSKIFNHLNLCQRVAHIQLKSFGVYEKCVGNLFYFFEVLILKKFQGM